MWPKGKRGDTTGRPSRQAAFLAHPKAKFFKETSTQKKNARREKAEGPGEHETMTENGDETMMTTRPFPLINGKGLRHDCNPSVASLRLYSHPRNGYSHRAGIHHSHRRNTQRNTKAEKYALNHQEIIGNPQDSRRLHDIGIRTRVERSRPLAFAFW